MTTLSGNRQETETASSKAQEKLREEIFRKLRSEGCRITKQREIILDIVLSGKCSSCKEIYQDAVRRDPSIGFATVYRLVNLLEDKGLIQSRNRFRLTGGQTMHRGSSVTIVFTDGTGVQMSWDEWTRLIQDGLRRHGNPTLQAVKEIYFSEN